MYVCTYLRDARMFQQRQGHACTCVLVSIDSAEDDDDDDDDVDDGGGFMMFMMTMVMLMLITMIFQIMLIMK